MRNMGLNFVHKIFSTYKIVKQLNSNVASLKIVGREISSKDKIERFIVQLTGKNIITSLTAAEIITAKTMLSNFSEADKEIILGISEIGHDTLEKQECDQEIHKSNMKKKLVVLTPEKCAVSEVTFDRVTKKEFSLLLIPK